MMMMMMMEEILSELERDDDEQQGGLPPGFRFHPTDEELITFYLASKVFNGTFCGVHIAEVDLNRCEPWELPDSAKMGEREWYFFSLRDRKYPTGLRTNRATGAGYWKATGKDREVVSAANGALLGMKKTLVFYKGRAPRGEKTKWVMHEYRLDGDFSCRHTGKEEWVICRIFHKLAEKKSVLQPQTSSFYNPLTSSLPPLLDHQDQFQDLKALVSQPDIIPNPIQPLISNQDLSLKDLSNAIAKQCKKDSHFRTLGAANTKFENPFLFGGNLGIPSATVDHHIVTAAMDAAAIDHVMSTEPAFRWW